MARLSRDEYKALQDKYGELYSYSKYSTYLEDPYGFYLSYIQRIKPDKPEGNFSLLGTDTHTLIENAYEKRWTRKQMLQYFRDRMEYYQLLQREFIAGDIAMNENIEKNYIECVEHYIKNFTPIDCNYVIEEMVSACVGKYFFYGFVDMSYVEYDKDEKDYRVIITDFKTSSLYSKADREKNKVQLILYAYAYSQKHKIPIEKIIIRWDFIKYVNVIFCQANGGTKVQTVKRNEIQPLLSRKVEMWAKKLKYNSLEILDMLLHIESENYHLLPEDIRNKFIIEHGYVEIELTQEGIRDLCDRIIEVCDEIEMNKIMYSLDPDDTIWWSEIDKSNEFYFNNLCNYSAKLHKPYAEYIEKNKDRWKNKRRK